MNNKIKYFVLVIVFFLGIIFERSQIDNKISKFFSNTIDGISQIFYSFASVSNINIDIQNKYYNKILETRKKALKTGFLKDEMQEWVPAKLTKENNNHEVSLRLKGAFPDHWSDNSRWSFKLKINNDSKPIENLRRVNLQPPETLSYLYEWLLNKALEKENLINLKLSYHKIILNGTNLGIYVMQEGISNETLHRNKKKLGPIIGFDKILYLEERINAERLKEQGILDLLNGLEDTFWRAKIKPVQLNNTLNNSEEQRSNLKKAIYLLDSFRNGKLKPSDVFDIEKLAKVMAIRAVLGSSEFDYRDTKFYFNPITSLLEPITKEIHVNLNLNFKDHYFWWIDSYKERPHYTNNTNFFLDLLYKENKFYEAYLKQLNYFSEGDYFKKLIEDNNSEFNQVYKIMRKNFPTKKIFSDKHLLQNKKLEYKIF